MGRLAGIARREKKRAPMETLKSAVISEQSGVADDFRGKPGNRQVSVLSTLAWQAACDELGENVPWTTRRANLLIEDLDLPQSAGQTIVIGEVHLRITMEVDPCSRMEEQAPGLKKALQPDWRGGVACVVLQGGKVIVGDAVTLIDAI
jgi:MOSC domain-containing protein YiiM